MRQLCLLFSASLILFSISGCSPDKITSKQSIKENLQNNGTVSLAFCGAATYAQVTEFVNLRQTPGLSVATHKISGVAFEDEIVGVLSDPPVQADSRTWFKIKTCPKADGSVHTGYIDSASLDQTLSQQAPYQGQNIRIVNPSVGDIGQIINQLNPGDTLVLSRGTYVAQQTIRMTQTAPSNNRIRIIGEPGYYPVVKRATTSAAQNIFNFQYASGIIVSGLEIIGSPQSGAAGDGFKIHDSSDIHIRGNIIRDVQVGVNAKRGTNGNAPLNRKDIFVIGNRITSTGVDQSTGEAIYIGCSDADSVYEGGDPNNFCHYDNVNISHNVIHDTGGSHAFGIQFKPGTRGNITNNSIWSVNLGILVWHGRGQRTLIEGNFIRGSRNEAAIQASEDFNAFSNVILSQSRGIQSNANAAQQAIPTNLSVCFNTLHGDFSRGLSLNDWGGSGRSQVLKSNIVYRTGDGSTFRGSGNFLENATVGSNAMKPHRPDLWANVGGDPSGAFEPIGTFSAPFQNIAALNAYLQRGSVLRAQGEACAGATKDFNGQPLTGLNSYNIGAYQTHGDNNPALVPIERAKLKGVTTLNSY